ncbi:MAG TPA: hypothetical protein VG318_07870 [Actinomycetota bacterium]|nr:hypothetical protein [Actinomycetota bacterium]
MGGYADKLQKAAGDVLRPGETVIGAIRTQPRGTAMGAAGGIVGAVAVGHQGGKARERATEGSVAASLPTSRFALGLTNERMLAFNYTAMGKPKDLQNEVPLDAVVNVERGGAKITNSVVVTFGDGSAIELETAKLEKVDDFIDAFKRTKAAT